MLARTGAPESANARFAAASAAAALLVRLRRILQASSLPTKTS